MLFCIRHICSMLKCFFCLHTYLTQNALCSNRGNCSVNGGQSMLSCLSCDPLDMSFGGVICRAMGPDPMDRFWFGGARSKYGQIVTQLSVFPGWLYRHPFLCPIFLELFVVVSKDLYLYKELRGKAVPLQTWTDPKGSRRLRLPDFKTIGTWRW